MSERDAVCDRLAEKLMAAHPATFKRVLRESHLAELIAAGQAMREGKYSRVWGICDDDECPTCKNVKAWDAAKAAFLKGAEK
jgi:hypothetical protein